MTTEEALRQFIVEELHWPGDPTLLTADYRLLETDTIDSLGIYAIVGFCEEDLGVRIDDEELVPENFETIRDIARLVDEKRSG
jgi:acyl carrier protein